MSAPKKNNLPLKLESEDEKLAREMQGMILYTTAELELKGLPPKEVIEKLANGVTVKMLARILTDNWEIPNAEQAMKVAKLAFDVARIHAGLPTSISAPADKDALKKMIADKTEAIAREREDRGG